MSSPPATAADAALSPSPQRKRKHEAAPADYLEKPVKFGKSSRDITCTREQFESMLKKSYGPRQNNDGIRKSGKDKHGHTLFWDEGLVRCQACNNKRVVYGAIVQHIIGEGHCRRVAKIYKDKESITYSKLALKKDDEESDEALEGEEEQMQVPVLPDHDNLLLDVAGGKKNSATKQKTPNKKVGKKKATSDGNSQNTLTVHGGLVVNGVDIVTYIRGLEGRVSDLERKLAASSSETNVL